MAAYFIDLDGTIFYWGTNIFLPGAIDFLRKVESEGHDIIFVTYRGHPDCPGTIPNMAKTTETLQSIGINYQTILWGVKSHRILVNDEKSEILHHPKDSPWD
jgi:hydroxymethylpyrimidine pyrophosphatase-like HAD family hydrolase